MTTNLDIAFDKSGGCCDGIFVDTNKFKMAENASEFAVAVTLVGLEIRTQACSVSSFIFYFLKASNGSHKMVSRIKLSACLFHTNSSSVSAMSLTWPDKSE
jgi:hypothetical protein